MPVWWVIVFSPFIAFFVVIGLIAVGVHMAEARRRYPGQIRKRGWR